MHKVASFNSQPPEGGCVFLSIIISAYALFQLTAARRRLQPDRALGSGCQRFNSQPPEGGCVFRVDANPPQQVSTHSRPKAAAPRQLELVDVGVFQLTAARRRLQNDRGAPSFVKRFQLTAARRRLLASFASPINAGAFQLTAARRRLPAYGWVRALTFDVSTHSRPKAAAHCTHTRIPCCLRFNSQPPEGGCSLHQNPRKIS